MCSIRYFNWRKSWVAFDLINWQLALSDNKYKHIVNNPAAGNVELM